MVEGSTSRVYTAEELAALKERLTPRAGQLGLDDTFLCPKHSVPMEKGPEKVLIKKIRVQEKDD